MALSLPCQLRFSRDGGDKRDEDSDDGGFAGDRQQLVPLPLSVLELHPPSPAPHPFLLPTTRDPLDNDGGDDDDVLPCNGVVTMVAQGLEVRGTGVGVGVGGLGTRSLFAGLV